MRNLSAVEFKRLMTQEHSRQRNSIRIHLWHDTNSCINGSACGMGYSDLVTITKLNDNFVTVTYTDAHAQHRDGYITYNLQIHRTRLVDYVESLTYGTAHDMMEPFDRIQYNVPGYPVQVFTAEALREYNNESHIRTLARMFHHTLFEGPCVEDTISCECTTDPAFNCNCNGSACCSSGN